LILCGYRHQADVFLRGSAVQGQEVPGPPDRRERQ
jgi:hypothetical protein